MILKIYPVQPDPQRIQKVVSALENGELVIYPTDTSYAIGCDAMNVRAIEHIYRLKNINPQKANLSIICRDLSEASEYAKISDKAFKVMKKNLPGPFTFILPTNSSLPKIYKNRKTVGIRVPDNNIILQIVETLGHPVLTTTVPPTEENEYSTDPELIHEKFHKDVSIVVDDGIGEQHLSTVVDFSGDEPLITREGKGILIY